MKIEDRYFTLLNMFLVEGAIYYLHYSILHFGYADKPMHYAISKQNLNHGSSIACFNPCTSKFKDNNKSVFSFNLVEELNLSNEKHEITYVLLSLSKCIKLTDFTKTALTVYKGKMREETLKKYRQAKREFILWSHNKRNKS